VGRARGAAGGRRRADRVAVAPAPRARRRLGAARGRAAGARRQPARAAGSPEVRGACAGAGGVRQGSRVPPAPLFARVAGAPEVRALGVLPAEALPCCISQPSQAAAGGRCAALCLLPEPPMSGGAPLPAGTGRRRRRARRAPSCGRARAARCSAARRGRARARPMLAARRRRPGSAPFARASSAAAAACAALAQIPG